MFSQIKTTGLFSKNNISVKKNDRLCNIPCLTACKSRGPKLRFTISTTQSLYEIFTVPDVGSNIQEVNVSGKKG